MKKKMSGSQFVRKFDAARKTFVAPARIVVAHAAKAGLTIKEKLVHNVRSKRRVTEVAALLGGAGQVDAFPDGSMKEHAESVVQMDGPEKGVCPLCEQVVIGSRRDGVWLPKRGEDHANTCPHAGYPGRPPPKSNNEDKLRAVAIEIGLGRAVEILETWREELQSAADA